MSPWPPEPAEPVRLSGNAYARGFGQAEMGGATADAVRAATVARVEAAEADGLLTARAEAWLARQRDFAAATWPDALDEVAGIADGFGFSGDVVFAHLFLGMLRDLRQTERADGDGCSAWAVGDGPDGPLAVKNRDYHGTHLGIQRVFRHDDPSWPAGPVLSVGSLGAPGAYSSGINAHGLALVDTQVGTSDHGIGWLRYFLMTYLLARCRTVGEAVAVIRGATHAGGGTLVMADAGGATAAVELGHGAVGIETGARVWRTNHFVSPELEPVTLTEPGDRVSQSSHARRAKLEALVAARAWTTADAARLMGGHDDDPMASLCQHGAADASSTISSSVFACASRSLYFCEGNPCRGVWRQYRLLG
jgi:predicted choloylglycine hydrolase